MLEACSKRTGKLLPQRVGYSIEAARKTVVGHLTLACPC